MSENPKMNKLVSSFRRSLKAISQHLEHNAAIQTGLLEDMRTLILQICIDPSLMEAVAIDIEETDFMVTLERIWRKHNIDGKEQIIYSYGQLYELFQVLNGYSKLKETASEQILYKMIAESSRNQIFCVIANNPSITHGQIVKKISLSKGRVSQIIKELRENKLIVEVRLGNKKGYAITPLGKRIFIRQKNSDERERMVSEPINGSEFEKRIVLVNQRSIIDIDRHEMWKDVRRDFDIEERQYENKTRKSMLISSDLELNERFIPDQAKQYSGV